MGQLSGGRDHTTVMHGINQMKQAGQVEKLLDEFWTRSL
jgi:chromosomal replication initiation ATPase DnaA